MENRPLDALRPHPRNADIYAGTIAASDDMVASVRTKGILHAVLITHDNRIISGHRRADAARRAGLSQIRVEVFGSTDELDILEALIHSNRQRSKDGLTLAREALALDEIGAAREEAAQRKSAAASASNIARSTPRPDMQQVTYPASQNGTARAAIGAALGVSGVTAERAMEAEKAARTLDAAGDTAQAGALRAVLRDSPTRAYQMGRTAGLILPKRQEAAPKVAPLTLDAWASMAADERASVLVRRDRAAHMNRQTTTHIEWAQWSWNPVTGCKHDCSYCYARDLAERYQADGIASYVHGFAPVFHPDRLGAPGATPLPAEAMDDVGLRNIFTCSMADLFGKWVPREWIEAVLDVVRDNPQWNFLFLTKFPTRLAEFSFPDNAWLGTSVDAQARIPNAEKAFARVQGGVKWLSCEPMLERLTFTRLDLFDWVVVGGASRSTQTPEFRPPRAWVTHLERQAEAAGCKVYEKTNLLERRREYPGAPAATPVVVPDAFKMGYLQRDVLPVPMAGAS